MIKKLIFPPYLKAFFWMQRNYRFFFMFVSSATLLCLYVFGICWIFIVRIRDRETTSIWKAMINYPAFIVIILYALLAVFFVGGLTAYHLYLISKNMVKITIKICIIYDQQSVNTFWFKEILLSVLFYAHEILNLFSIKFKFSVFLC